MTVYDPRGMGWDQYCRLMSELFAAQQLGTVEEDSWKEWVDALSGIGYFGNSSVPDSRGYENWQDWAQHLVGIMDIKATQ